MPTWLITREFSTWPNGSENSVSKASSELIDSRSDVDYPAALSQQYQLPSKPILGRGGGLFWEWWFENGSNEIDPPVPLVDKKKEEEEGCERSFIADESWCWNIGACLNATAPPTRPGHLGPTPVTDVHSSCFRAAVTSCFNQLQNLHFLSFKQTKAKNKQTNKKKKGKERKRILETNTNKIKEGG